MSPNDLAEQERLPSLRYGSNHFLFDTSVFSLALIFHCSALRHAVNDTHEELKYNLLTFTIFIIQSQVGAIPVFSRWYNSVFLRKFCRNYREGKGFLEAYRPSSGTEVYISRQWNKPPPKNSPSSWRRFVKTLF